MSRSHEGCAIDMTFRPTDFLVFDEKQQLATMLQMVGSKQKDRSVSEPANALLSSKLFPESITHRSTLASESNQSHTGKSRPEKTIVMQNESAAKGIVHVYSQDSKERKYDIVNTIS